jgi:RNA polymerase subunit RPABC4/transcription elongation factor Spt4
MECIKCGFQNPKQSKLCKKCGELLRILRRCPQCGSENPGDSLFCVVCGAGLSEVRKPAKEKQRKCRACGQFNELDTRFCVVCGEEMVRGPKGDQRRSSFGPSYKTVALVIGMAFLAGLAVKLAITFSKGEGLPELNSAPVLTSSMVEVDEAQVIAVAKNFKCACGGCGELPLVTCNCDMSKGSVEEKRFIREKLAEGFTVEQVIEQLDKKYGHRV